MNKAFMCFAYKYIFGEMYELVNKSRSIKLNKYYLKLYREIEMARIELTQQLSKAPTLTEICLYLEIDEQEATDVMLLTGNMLSLEDEYNSLSGDEVTLKDCIGTVKDVDSQILVQDSLGTLEPLEQSVMDYRYFQDLTQNETAQALGISQVKVSRLETSSKKKIKAYIAA